MYAHALQTKMHETFIEETHVYMCFVKNFLASGEAAGRLLRNKQITQIPFLFLSPGFSCSDDHIILHTLDYNMHGSVPFFLIIT